MFRRMGRSFLRLSSAPREPFDCQNVRTVGFWWGHETVEDKENAKRQVEEMKIIHWQSPDTSLLDVQPMTYTPLRVMKEETALDVCYNKKNPGMADWYAFANYPRWYSAGIHEPGVYKAVKRIKAYRKLVEVQGFNRERLLALGPDLSAAHFLLSKGCRLRFRDKSGWLPEGRQRALDRLPRSYESGWHVEAIDASSSHLVYEGIQNLRNLIFLKSLDLSYCPHIDSFCMDRITGEFKDSLEELNVSGCPQLRLDSLECLWRLRKLKVLTLRDLDHIEDVKLLCLMLLEEMPNLEIRGVDYADVKLLEGTEHHHLLEEYEQALLEGGVPAVTDDGARGEEERAKRDNAGSMRGELATSN